MTAVELAQQIDHTLLKPTTTITDIAKLCEEAKMYGFKTVCVPPVFVNIAKGFLHESLCGVCTVIGFPLGIDMPDVKALAAREAVRRGASEIDMVINIGALKSGQSNYVQDEIKRVLKTILAENKQSILKVIIETCLLNEQEKIRAARCIQKAGGHFVKTSTGFSTGGATLEDVNLLFNAVGHQIGVKASGGIRDYETAKAMIAAGATRIGTSRSVEIIKQSFEKSL